MENTNNPEKAVNPDSVVDGNGKTVNMQAGDKKTESILCWVIVILFTLPILSFFFLNDENEELQWNAKNSMYFGFAIIILHLLALCPSALLCGIPNMLVWLLQVIVGIMGAVKASNGERFEIPVISGMAR